MEKSLLYVVIPVLKGQTDIEDITKCKKAVEDQWSDEIDLRMTVIEGETYPEIYNAALANIRWGYILFLLPWVILNEGVVRKIAPILGDKSCDMFLFGHEDYIWNERSVVKMEDAVFTNKQLGQHFLQYKENFAFNVLWNKILSVEKIRKLKLNFECGWKENYAYHFLFRYLIKCEKIRVSSIVLTSYWSVWQKETSALDRVFENKCIFGLWQQYISETMNNAEMVQQLEREMLDYIVYERARLNEVPKAQREEMKTLLKEIKKMVAGGLLRKEWYIVLGVLRSLLGPKHRKQFREDRRKRYALRKKERLAQREQDRQRNFYKKRCLGRRLHSFFSSKKSILLYCESPTMKPHIMDYYQCVKQLENCKFYIYYPDQWDAEHREGLRIVKSKMWALYAPWDLVVCADASAPLYYRKEEAELLYINHGLHMISYDGGESLYAYAKGAGVSEDGEAVFSAMLEPNKSYARVLMEENAALSDRVYHVGYKNAEQIRNSADKYLWYREKLKIEDDQIAVALFGTWGTDSLFHRVGESLIKQAKVLMKEGYRFILSIHPKEYSEYDPMVCPMGKYIDSLEKEGFIIRNPSESSTPYMMAADVVICDYSTLCEEAMLAGKPVILSEFPKERVWRRSIIANYKQNGLTYSNGDDLRETLHKCMDNESLITYSQKLVEDLIPPQGGYRQAVWNVTKMLLNEKKKCGEKNGKNTSSSFGG